MIKTDNERLKIWIDLAKWVLGTFGLTLISICINKGFNERIQSLNEIKAYQEHIDLITTAENIEKRWLLAQFFSTVTVSEKQREGWKKYFILVDSMMSEHKKQKDILDSISGLKKSEKIKKDIKESIKLNNQPLISKYSISKEVDNLNQVSLPDSIVEKYCGNKSEIKKLRSKVVGNDPIKDAEIFRLIRYFNNKCRLLEEQYPELMNFNCDS